METLDSVVASEAIQNASAATVWIASSLQRKIATQFCRGLLAMTEYYLGLEFDGSGGGGLRGGGEMRQAPALRPAISQ